jgi:hypothetical protein
VAIESYPRVNGRAFGPFVRVNGRAFGPFVRVNGRAYHPLGHGWRGLERLSCINNLY